MQWTDTATAVAGLSPETWLAVGSALAALVSFLLNWQMVRRQAAMQFESLKAQIDADVIAWGQEGLNALTQAAFLVEQRGASLTAPEYARERAVCLSNLSALVDKGRLHFPNAQSGPEAPTKSRAFRGGRPFILNPLVFAFHALDAATQVAGAPDPEAARFFVACRREFVSELQHQLNPRRRAESLRRLGAASIKVQSAAYEDSLRLAEMLEARHPGLLAAKGDDGWARNLDRAKEGDRAPPPRNRRAADA
jgi:hypothetical protein